MVRRLERSCHTNDGGGKEAGSVYGIWDGGWPKMVGMRDSARRQRSYSKVQKVDYKEP